ncbi:MAG: flippase-like domain-containing protein [Cytophagaceae bacterium]|nr:flippase-like domain-containing protein [Cytophagaceae bacterium]
MNSKLKQILQYGLSLVAGLVLLWLFFRKEDMGAIWLSIKSADYSWVLITYALTLIAHFARAYRWNLLLKQTGYKVSNGEAFLALLAGYGANLVLPRAGEIVRCTILRTRQKVSFDTSLGTVVAERLVDLICLVFLFTLAIFWQYDILFGFTQKIISGLVSEKISMQEILYWVLGLAVVNIFLFFFIRQKIKNYLKQSQHPAVTKIRDFIKGVKVGFFSVLELPSKWAFLLSTIVIWVSYFFMAYLIFFSLPATSSLGMGAGLAILVMGAFGIAAPVQGGIGAYHWIVSQTLLLYGIGETAGKTYATLAHASQMAFTILFSLVSFALILLIKPKTDDLN